MWTWWRRPSKTDILLAELAAQREAQREALDLLAGAFKDSLRVTADAQTRVAEAVSRQAGFFDDWLKLFQTSAPPEARIVRDRDEADAEAERLKARGFPVGASPLDQLRHIERETAGAVVDLESLFK